MRTAPLLTVVLALLLARDARADRVLASTDALGSWAIEAKLVFGIHQADRLFDDGAGLRINEVVGGSPGLGMRVWPGEGFFAGFAARWQGIERGKDDRPSRFADLTLESGVRRRLGPSIPWAIELRARVPSSDPLLTSGRFEVELTPRIGLSFTPRHDFYFDLHAGTASPDQHGIRSEYWAGFSVGMAYQNRRWTLLLFGSNRWHLAEPTSFRSGSGGGMVGFEIVEGMSLAWEMAGSGTDSYLVATGVRGSFFELSSLVSLRWAFYPGARSNSFRSEDPRRGREYRWWNPSPAPTLPR